MPKIRWLIIWMCFIANAISYIDRANLAIATPFIRQELGLDAAAMGVVLSAFFWTYAAMQLPAGWIISSVPRGWGRRVSLYRRCKTSSDASRKISRAFMVRRSLRNIAGNCFSDSPSRTSMINAARLLLFESCVRSANFGTSSIGRLSTA